MHYFDAPIIFERDGEYHILTQKDEDGSLYESVKELTRTEKNMDRFIKLLLTRINSKYRYQNEIRIILGGRNIPSFDSNISGYKIQVPKGAIVNLYKFKDTDESFVNQLIYRGLGPIK